MEQDKGGSTPSSTRSSISSQGCPPKRGMVRMNAQLNLLAKKETDEGEGSATAGEKKDEEKSEKDDKEKDEFGRKKIMAGRDLHPKAIVPTMPRTLKRMNGTSNLRALAAVDIEVSEESSGTLDENSAVLHNVGASSVISPNNAPTDDDLLVHSPKMASMRTRSRRKSFSEERNTGNAECEETRGGRRGSERYNVLPRCDCARNADCSLQGSCICLSHSLHSDCYGCRFLMTGKTTVRTRFPLMGVLDFENRRIRRVLMTDN